MTLKFTRELLQLINTFSKVAGYKINSKNSVALLYINDKWTETEIRLKCVFGSGDYLSSDLGLFLLIVGAKVSFSCLSLKVFKMWL